MSKYEKRSKYVKRQAGFTLIEVLASLLIFSTAILGLMHAGTENIRAMNVLEQKQLAGIIADNQLLLALNRPTPPRVGVEQDSGEMAGRDWNWRIQTEDTGTAGFFRLTITVQEKTSEQILMTRTAFVSTRPVVNRPGAENPGPKRPDPKRPDDDDQDHHDD